MPKLYQAQEMCLNIHRARLRLIPVWGTPQQVTSYDFGHPWDCSMYIIRLVREILNNQNIANTDYKTIDAANIVREWCVASKPVDHLAFPVVGLCDTYEENGKWNHITHIGVLLDDSSADKNNWLVLNHHIEGDLEHFPGIYSLGQWGLLDVNLQPHIKDILTAVVPTEVNPRYRLWGPVWLSPQLAATKTEYIKPGVQRPRAPLTS